MEKKENSKSLYLYTSLIFIVALAMIIISFFGQSNLEKTNKAIQDQKTITEKSAALSEENMRLVERNIQLENELSLKTSAIDGLNAQVLQKDEKIAIYENLMTAYAYHTLGKDQKAKEILALVDYEALEGDSKVLYTQIMDDIK